MPGSLGLDSAKPFTQTLQPHVGQQKTAERSSTVVQSRTFPFPLSGHGYWPTSPEIAAAAASPRLRVLVSIEV
jgi:hypothetical protein